MVKKAKKRNVSNISQKKLLTFKMPRLRVGVQQKELEFSEEKNISKVGNFIYKTSKFKKKS